MYYNSYTGTGGSHMKTRCLCPLTLPLELVGILGGAVHSFTKWGSNISVSCLFHENFMDSRALSYPVCKKGSFGAHCQKVKFFFSRIPS